MDIEKLKFTDLYNFISPELLNFKSTKDLKASPRPVGQKRALEAIEFGTQIDKKGYNIFVTGPKSIGKHRIIKDYLETIAKDESEALDWCYVNNFEDQHKPIAISLPSGQATEFKESMDQLISDLKALLPTIFESEHYQSQCQKISDEIKTKQDQVFSALQDEAEKNGLAFVQQKTGFLFVPSKDGKPLVKNEFDLLPQEDQDKIQKTLTTFEKKLSEYLHQIPSWEKERLERTSKLNKELIEALVDNLTKVIYEKYSKYVKIKDFLDKVRSHILLQSKNLLPMKSKARSLLINSFSQNFSTDNPLDQYRVNVLFEHRKVRGAPVVYLDNPTYQNTIGRIEHTSNWGALSTNFTLIKPGAIHEANGGYLIIDANKLLSNLYVWEALKRTLRAEQIKITSLGQEYSLTSTLSLEPEPIPLNTKVLLFGSWSTFQLLSQYDPDFSDLFKVTAGFETEMDRTEENIQSSIQLIAKIINEENLLPFSSKAVSRILEESSRETSDQEKLSLQISPLANLARESEHWAKKNSKNIVDSDDVNLALEKRINRVDQIRELFLDEVARGFLIINTKGLALGQVNGLSVYSVGDSYFGKAIRITANISIGRGKMVDIEREVDLGGALHSKGVLILYGYLNSYYARNFPLSISASLVFEQSYNEVEGDSASAGELMALLSAIANTPIKQNLAITGSVNQKGEIQSIGGVNEKIEGYFDICKIQGLTGDQGVIIPKANVKNLMLRHDVIEAVKTNQFSIYPVSTINECIHILSDLPAGERIEDGQFLTGTFNFLVEKQLVLYAESMSRLFQ